MNDELFNLLMKNKIMKEHFLRVSKNNRNGMLKQFKQLDDLLHEILTSSSMRDDFFSMLLEQKRALSTRVSSSENANHTGIPCLRAQQFNSAHRGLQACKFQTIVEAIALHLNIWVYTDKIEKHFVDGTCSLPAL